MFDRLVHGLLLFGAGLGADVDDDPATLIYSITSVPAEGTVVNNGDGTFSFKATYTPPAGLTSTTTYRRYAKDATCNTTPTASTGDWTVTVRPNFTSGTIASTGETICYGGTPAQIGSTTDRKSVEK